MADILEPFRPCPVCGSLEIAVQKLDIQEYPNWFVKCLDCKSACTTVNAIRDNAVKQWNEFWCWDQLDASRKYIEELKIQKLRDLDKLTEDQTILKYRFEKLMDEYIKHRLDHSGSFGNLSAASRRELMIKEIAAELDWK